MNCWLWIILLLCCGGNCGNSGCDNQCRTNSCNGNTNWNNCRRQDCCCAEHVHSCGGTVTEHDCGCVDKVDSCGCVAETNDCGFTDERCDCECHNHDMPYEMYGCQENGIPCPPPIPTPYLR